MGEKGFYPDGRKIPPESEWEPRVFFRKGHFYMIQLPVDCDLNYHAKCNPGTLTAGDKRKLRAAGVVTVEAERPEDVRLIQTEGPAIGGGDMLLAAMKAISVGGNGWEVRETFTKLCAQYMEEARAATP